MRAQRAIRDTAQAIVHNLKTYPSSPVSARLTAYEINGKEYEVEYDLDNPAFAGLSAIAAVCKNSVEKHRRLVGVLDGVRVANAARRVSSREAAANQYRYDAFGRRIIRKEGSTNSALIWWGNSEKHRRLVGVLGRSPATSPDVGRVKARGASLNQCAEHKHQAGQTVIQNDIMAHPSRLNSVIARAVDGSKFKLEWYHKNYPALTGLAMLANKFATEGSPANAGTGDILEHYRYTAFGEVTIYDDNGAVQTETQIDNTILWNTRRRDEVSGFYMYKFRHYAPELGRWPSRDPIEERGGVNLYAFVGNSSLMKWDRLGQSLGWSQVEDLVRDVEQNVYEHDEVEGVDAEGRRNLTMRHKKRLAILGEIWNKYAHKVHGGNKNCYTACEAIVDFFNNALQLALKDEYLGIDFDETKFVNDIGFVLGGIDSKQNAISWISGEMDDRYKRETYFRDLRSKNNKWAGFKNELDDTNNTIRHTIANLAFGYEYGDTLTNIGAWMREPDTDSKKDRENAYVAIDLGEELDDAVEVFGGVDLDDLPAAFGNDFCDDETLKRLKAKYKGVYNFEKRRKLY